MTCVASAVPTIEWRRRADLIRDPRIRERGVVLTEDRGRQQQRRVVRVRVARTIHRGTAAHRGVFVAQRIELIRRDRDRAAHVISAARAKHRRAGSHSQLREFGHERKFDHFECAGRDGALHRGRERAAFDRRRYRYRLRIRERDRKRVAPAEFADAEILQRDGPVLAPDVAPLRCRRAARIEALTADALHRSTSTRRSARPAVAVGRARLRRVAVARIASMRRRHARPASDARHAHRCGAGACAVARPRIATITSAIDRTVRRGARRAHPHRGRERDPSRSCRLHRHSSALTHQPGPFTHVPPMQTCVALQHAEHPQSVLPAPQS